MAKKLILTLIAMIILVSFSWAAANPWSNLKKIYFFDSSGDISAVKENLTQLDAQNLIPAEKIELLQKLNELGDRYFKKKNFPLAETFYQKILLISPQDAWPIYNKLEKINKLKVNLLWNFKNIGRQLELVSQDFSGTFLLLNCFFNILFFSSLLLFYLSIAIMFLKYFKLVMHDFILGGNSDFQSKKLIFLLILLLWPLTVLGGWGYYPFLFCGFMWFYFDHDDRVNIKRVVGILLAMTLISSVNNYLEKSLQNPGFQTIKNIYAGHLFSEQSYNRFDNEMKVMQAYAYYNQHKTDTALDILQSTGNNYNSTLKLNLLANIYREKGNIAQSIQFYRQSLSLDDQNKVTLKNFTLALLKNNDPELFKFYLKNYPEIMSYKDNISISQTIKLPEKILWKRLLNFSWEDFHFWNFLSNIAVEFFKIPILLACLIMLVYISLLKKLSPILGQSTFCNKCAKIIKKKSIEQAHTLCEDCYQLFLIKDPIFLEAKIIKEKEISRQFRFKYFLSLIASLFIPGFCLNFKNKSNVFTFTFLLFFNVFGFYLFSALTFKNFFGTIPMFINFIGIFAIILYLAINAYSLRGDDHGF
jgi:tetratricopeptide (TPR) repeat protein